ncbi:unnamed protein product [Microthlaspi erraticum]|uniref:Flavin-containing monooxygenase n=1 Tax=Microthlaspi erraticum TaxID=1685480 RepID=A0A6D2JP05_9BRAS|nr:unnamed protein product [Microthlaspi erraticum]
MLVYVVSPLAVDDNRVGPLYKHIFPPPLAPWLSFVGIPCKVIPFPMFELQSKWIAGVLSGRIMLPSEEIKKLYATLEGEGIPKRHTHSLGSNHFEYNDWLALQYGCSGTEEWRKEMFLMSFMRKMENPETYGDGWEDHHHLVALFDSNFKIPEIVYNSST